MSWLVFNRTLGKIYLMEGRPEDREIHTVVGSWKAHNNTTSSSNGEWPTGKYKFQGYKAHDEEGLLPACNHLSYGCMGIHIVQPFYDNNGIWREGMGTHTGRTFGQDDVLGGKTLGCVRITPEAMKTINEINRTDKLTYIVIR